MRKRHFFPSALVLSFQLFWTITSTSSWTNLTYSGKYYCKLYCFALKLTRFTKELSEKYFSFSSKIIYCQLKSTSMVKIYWTFYNISLHMLTWTHLSSIYPFPAMQSLLVMRYFFQGCRYSSSNQSWLASSVGVASQFQRSQHRKQFWRKADNNKNILFLFTKTLSTFKSIRHSANQICKETFSPPYQ